tara:strand:+ start:1212 stop:2297 length:1086 start_codon:yes stop_codon:yes gene_type:complete
MHILQILPMLNEGGVERGTLDVNRELVKKGIKSTVISNGGKHKNIITTDQGNYIELNSSSKNIFSFYSRSKQLSKVFCALKPDIIHYRSRVPAWLSYYANKNHNIPLVSTVHGFNSVNKYSEIMIKSDLIIYGSSSILNHIIKNYNVDESKLRYIPRGIDTSYFSENNVNHNFVNKFKNENNLNDVKIISSIGRITEWKGHDQFIEAISQLQKRNFNVVGLIIGGVWSKKDKYYTYLKNLVKEKNANIKFIGSVENISDFYSLSDLVVSASSVKAETFGRTIAESLSMNTPVIASAHGGALDIIINKENGLIFEPNNLKDLISKIEEALIIDFKNMSNHINLNFGLETMISKLISVYKELM